MYSIVQIRTTASIEELCRVMVMVMAFIVVLLLCHLALNSESGGRLPQRAWRLCGD